MSGKIIYTADEEEPRCERCDNVCGSDDTCVNRCGAEHGWALYSRTVIETEEAEGTEE